MSGRAATDACPTIDRIEQFARGASADEDLRVHVEQCAECGEHLRQVRADNEFLAEFVQANGDRLGAERPLSIGDAPTGYRILDEIERGSQGVVYRAQQLATNRLVALKMVLQGAFSTERQRRRFEREVELVASLRHPNIVTVYDSGVTDDGRPYVAMELVAGRPLDQWLASVEAGTGNAAATVDMKLRLFADLCEALSSAHRRGIIHRDLKPANILVDAEGQPHVLDFGLAKLVGAESIEDAIGATMVGEFLGTFAYAAPEQVAADPSQIDTRTDVYSLGVILYEMLTGERPYELTGPVSQIAEKILHAQPRPFSEVAGPLDRDVETIALTALAKDASRRYQSVDALLADVRHYLAGSPIDARRDDALYVLMKTARRYRVPLGVAGMVFAMVIAFAVVAFSMYQDKLSEAARTMQTMRSLVAVLGSTDQENPDAPLPVSSIRRLLDESSRIVDSGLADYPEVAAAVRSSLGLAYLSHSQFDEAEAQLTAALDSYRQLHHDPHPDLARGLHNVGRLHWKRGDYAAAASWYRDSLSMWQELHPGDHADTARTMHHLASSLRLQGLLQESDHRFREALQMRQRMFDPQHPEVGNNLNGLGNCLRDQGRYEEALESYEQSLDIISHQLQTLRDWRAARVMHRVGLCLIDLGRLDDAEVRLEESLAIKREFRMEDDPDIADGLEGLAHLRLARGQLQDAETLCREALEIRDATLDEDHPDRLDTVILLGRILLERGQVQSAETMLRAAAGTLSARLGEQHWRVAAANVRLGACLVRQQQFGEARTVLTAALKTLERVLAETSNDRRAAAAALAALPADAKTAAQANDPSVAGGQASIR